LKDIYIGFFLAGAVGKNLPTSLSDHLLKKVKKMSGKVEKCQQTCGIAV